MGSLLTTTPPLTRSHPATISQDEDADEGDEVGPAVDGEGTPETEALGCGLDIRLQPGPLSRTTYR